MAGGGGPWQKQRLTTSRLRGNRLFAVAGSGRSVRVDVAEASSNVAAMGPPIQGVG